MLGPVLLAGGELDSRISADGLTVDGSVDDARRFLDSFDPPTTTYPPFFVR